MKFYNIFKIYVDILFVMLYIYISEVIMKQIVVNLEDKKYKELTELLAKFDTDVKVSPEEFLFTFVSDVLGSKGVSVFEYPVNPAGCAYVRARWFKS